MTSKILFLGTGGDAFVVGKQLLGSGGIIVQFEQTQLHIDPGPASLLRAREERINIRENTAVLVSTPHLIHANDVNAVLHAMTYGGFDIKGVLVGNVEYIGGQTKDHIGLLPAHHAYVEKILPLIPGQKVAVETVEIQGLRTFTDGIGFKLFTPHFVLAYSSRVVYHKDLAQEYQNVDILILHVPFPSGNKDGFSTDDAIKLLRKCTPGLVIITGFGKKNA